MCQFTSVLLVDDNDDFLLMWKMLLRHDQRIGRIQVAHSGEEAMRRLILDGPPALLLADVWMDGISGYDLVDFIRRVYPDTPVVLTSAAEGTGAEALRRGATGFLPKTHASSDHLGDLLCQCAAAARIEDSPRHVDPTSRGHSLPRRAEANTGDSPLWGIPWAASSVRRA